MEAAAVILETLPENDGNKTLDIRVHAGWLYLDLIAK